MHYDDDIGNGFKGDPFDEAVRGALRGQADGFSLPDGFAVRVAALVASGRRSSWRARTAAAVAGAILLVCTGWAMNDIASGLGLTGAATGGSSSEPASAKSESPEEPMTASNATKAVLAAAPAAAPVATPQAETGAFGLLYEPDSYVQDGLVLHLDGVRNVGGMKPHDPAAATWKDLSATGNDVALTVVNFGGAWLADGFRFERDSDTTSPKAYAFGTLSAEQDFGKQFTIQIVVDDVVTNEVKGLWPTLFGVDDGDTCNIYQYWGRSSVHFKVDDFTGLDVNSRARQNSWSGRYLNAAFDAGLSAIVEADSFAQKDWKGTRNGSAPGSAGWMFGAAGIDGDNRAKRALKGTIKAIRVYSRILSNDELAANRALDEIRFFAGIPVTNVVVATSVPGAEAKEPSGAYAVGDAGRVFSAPAEGVTVGDDLYMPTGFILETWDRDSGEWGVGVTNAALSYAASPDGKVRLTWLWGKSSGPGEDAAFDGYVTDGLVLHLDGIRNAGRGAGHGSTSATWVDLSPTGARAVFRRAGSDASAWRRDGYHFGGKTVAVLDRELDLGSASTVQIVCDVDPRVLEARWADNTSLCWPHLFGTTNANDTCNVYYNADNTQLLLSAKVGGSHVLNMGSGIWEGRYVTVLMNGATAAAFQTAAPASTAAFTKEAGSFVPVIGGSDGSGRGYDNRYFAGTIKAVRVYDRALTAAELERNRAVDEARFFGGAPSAAAGEVVVVSDVAEARAQNGSYTPSGGYEFVSPTAFTTPERDWRLVGWKTETWNSETGSWEPEGEGAGNRWPAPDGSGWASRRLTWRWAVSRGLRRVDYDVGDYAQSGLVLHLDGLRNRGAELDHDGGAGKWVDLSKSTNDVTFTDGGRGWTADGYSFDSVNYGFLGRPQNLGQTMTVQIVCDVDASRQTKSWPTLLGAFKGTSGDALNIYTRLSDTPQYGQLVWKTSGSVGGGYATLPGWGGKYVTAIYAMAKDRKVVTEGVSVANTDWARGSATSSGATGDLSLFLGSAEKAGDETYAEARGLVGTVNAVRVYRRVLSNDELAMNRRVDEARFRGVRTVNVVVAEGKYQTTTEAPGSYEVEGSWRFTAEPALNEKGRRRAVVGHFVEEWNATTGRWGEKQLFGGDKYVYVAGVSPAKVRLTWKWEGERFMIIYK